MAVQRGVGSVSRCWYREVWGHSADAGQVLEPASAFIFFEQQLEELIEDHELGSEIKYWDTNQLPGE